MILLTAPRTAPPKGIDRLGETTIALEHLDQLGYHYDEDTGMCRGWYALKEGTALAANGHTFVVESYHDGVGLVTWFSSNDLEALLGFFGLTEGDSLLG